MLRSHVTHEDHELADNDTYKPTSQLSKRDNIYVLDFKYSHIFKYSKQLVCQINSLNWNVIYLLETTCGLTPPPQHDSVFEY